MSHSTVMVITKDDPRTTTAVTDALAPFDENTRMEPYREYVDEPAPEFWATKSLREKGHLSHAAEDSEITWQQIRDAYLVEWPDSSDAPIPDEEDPTQAYTMSTYNPKSKWDWWTIGGRWMGSLFVRDAAPNLVGLGKSGAFDNDRMHSDGFDICQAGNLDVVRMRGNAELTFRQKHESIRAQLRELNLSHRTWEQTRTAVGDNIDLAREAYWEQPSMLAYKALLPKDEALWASGETLDQILMVSEQEFERQVKIEVARAIPCFATLDQNGQWHEPGRMGWWGMSTDDESSRIGYYEAINAMIENADSDLWLTVVDVHI